MGHRSFNPRPRMGGDYGGNVDRLQAEFQSTPPYGGRHRVMISNCFELLCFNPRPRMGGDDLHDSHLRNYNRVSIHAPVWGATILALLIPSKRISFNPRPRMGGDQMLCIPGRSTFSVSIHAPVWGATLSFLPCQ